MDIAGYSLNLGTMFGGVLDGLFILLLLAVVAVVGYFIWFIRQFKHKIRVKEVINGRKIIYDNRARECKDADGVPHWQLLKGRTMIEVPPTEAIEVDYKGRKCVEAYKTETGDYIFGKDVAQIKDVPKEILEIKDPEKRADKLAQWKKENKVIDAFQPLTTPQRIVLINQIKKAIEKKKKRWQEMLLPIVGIAALVIIVVALMIFYADMAKPLLNMADKQIQYETIHKEELEILNQMKNDIQVIKGEKSNYKGEPPS